MKKEQLIDHMKYLPDMDVIDSTMLEDVLKYRDNYDETKFTAKDVRRALGHIREITPEDFEALLSPAAEPFLEEMTFYSQQETRRQFGNSIYMFTPLYLANYCDNYCIYCGFNCHNNIKRAKLDEAGMIAEMKAIAATGLEEILMLTGESPSMSDIKYIGQACELAKKYFRTVGLEIYPTNVEDYKYLHQCGCDYITVFQETYNSEKYKTLHLGGNKRIFPYRFYSQERALLGGMRGVGFAALLGLDDFRQDALATGMHAWFIQKKYPHADIALSCPRLRPIVNNDKINPKDVHEPQLLQIITAYRLFLPFANITISSRERAEFRDNIIKLGITKTSAGSKVGIGGHTKSQEDGDDQFEIADNRGVAEMYEVIKNDGLQPVMNDHVLV